MNSTRNSKKILEALVLIVVFSLVCVSANAATRYVPSSQYSTIQAAINACNNGDTVVVAPDTYTGPGNRAIYFNGKAITVRSETGPENCIIDGEGYGAPGFLFTNAETENSVLDGFTITNFNSCGIYCYSSSPTIRNCIISNNTATYGGGIDCREYSHPNITKCVIRGNTSTTGGYGGGGIFCNWGCDPKISNCVITSNSAAYRGGGIYFRHFCHLKLINCEISKNTAYDGGGICHAMFDRLEIINCTIAENIASNNGGGLYLDYVGPPITISNSNLWGNTASNSGNQIFKEGYRIPTFSFCDIEGCGGSGGGWDSALGNDGGNNIDIDPRFVDSGAGDYHLIPNSPCNNAGDPSGSYAGQTDIDGEPRVMNGRIDIGADECSEPPPETELKIGDAVADIPGRGLAPYDQIILYVPVKVSSSVASNVVLTFKLGPSAIVSGSWDGQSYSDEPLFKVHNDDEQQVVSPGFSGDLSVRIDIKGTDSDAIMDHIVEYSSSGMSLDDGLTVDAELNGGGGSSTDTFDIDIKNKETDAVAHIVYPSFDTIVGDPPSNGEVDGFYTRGDTNYHHGLHSLVRKYALEAARFGGERIPESPSAAASSIADYVTAVLKPKGDPDVYVAPDTKITEWVEDGLLGIGIPYLPTPYVKGHICIEHAYLFSSLSRTIGLPTREVTVALGTDLFQVWNVVLDVTFGYQEAATQVWHDGQWNYYDMYIYGTGIRDIAEYLTRWPVVRAWYAFDRQYAHSFAIQTGNGEASDSAHWSHLADEHKPGLIIIAYSPVTMDLVDSGGRVIADKFSKFTDPVPSVNPSMQIPGAFHRLPESVGFTDSADPSTSVELPEMIFVPDDAGSDNCTLTVKSVADGEYTLVLGLITGLQGEEVVHMTSIILEDESHEYEIQTDAEEITMVQMPLMVDVDPDVVNRKGGGNWITAYLELPENTLGVTINDIDLGSITANGVNAETNPKYDFVTEPEILDRDGDGWSELMVKFSLEELLSTLGVGENQEVRVAGMVGSIIVTGSDHVRVLEN